MAAIFEVFEKCQKYTLDPYWKEQFQNFAQNKFPQGVRYDQNRRCIIIRIEGKKNEVVVLPDKPSEIFTTMIDIMKNTLNLRSTRDLKIEKEEINKIIKKRICDTDCQWSQLKPRNLKDQLIMDYIGYLKTYYSLTPVETKKLISTLQIAFKFKYISQDDINYVKGKVKSIKGLKFNKKTREFVVPYNSSSNIPTRATKQISNKFYTELDKYVKNHNTRSAKYVL